MLLQLVGCPRWLLLLLLLLWVVEMCPRWLLLLMWVVEMWWLGGCPRWLLLLLWVVEMWWLGGCPRWLLLLLLWVVVVVGPTASFWRSPTPGGVCWPLWWLR